MEEVKGVSPRIEAADKRYRAAAHAMQTCVLYKMHNHPAETSPKHLRTGINSAMVDSSALATLLIAKGIFTEEEYIEAVADAMERELKFYLDELGLRRDQVE